MKNIPAQEMDKKKSCKLQMSHPTYHFPNGPSLIWQAIGCFTTFRKTKPVATLLRKVLMLMETSNLVTCFVARGSCIKVSD